MSGIDMVDAGRRLINQASARGIPIRLLGGVAISLRAGDEARGLFGRTYPDLDFVVRKKQSRAFRSLLEELGHEPQKTFNAMHGAKRQLYHSPNGYQLDIFLDVVDARGAHHVLSRCNVDRLMSQAILAELSCSDAAKEAGAGSGC